MSPEEGKGFTKVEVERNRSFGIRPGPDLWETALQEEVTTMDTAEIWDLERESWGHGPEAGLKSGSLTRFRRVRISTPLSDRLFRS